jgi:hypothetical protein
MGPHWPQGFFDRVLSNFSQDSPILFGPILGQLAVSLCRAVTATVCLFRGGLSLLSGNEPAEQALGVFVPVLINPQRGLGEPTHAGRNRAHRLGSPACSSPPTPERSPAPRTRPGDLDRVRKPLRDTHFLCS